MWFYRIFALVVIAAVPLGATASGAGHSQDAFGNIGSISQQKDQPKDQSDDQDRVRLRSTLIQVPTIVVDHSGKFIADLTKSNFTVFEDGKRQEVGTFGAVKEPFNVVLVLDTSNSAEDRLRAIQNTAIAFIHQLGPADRAMVISFDNEIRQLTDFTADREELDAVVKNTEAGFGKLLYEAVDRALNELREVDGRRAVILFTDGVDLDSIAASNAGTIALAEQIGATIYCVQFDTRWWVESAARKQQAEEDANSRNTAYGADGRIPLPGGPMGGGGQPSTGPHVEVEASGVPSITVTRDNGRHGTITENLDTMYNKADVYLKGLSDRSGGKLFKTLTESDTERAFAAIVEELHNQYVIGYYPTSVAGDGKYHKIKVQVDRKDLDVRSRQGYRAEKQ
jgi:VWFA-related protein